MQYKSFKHSFILNRGTTEYVVKLTYKVIWHLVHV